MLQFVSRVLSTVLVLLCLAFQPVPAHALNIFGFTLFEDDAEEAGEVVDPVAYSATLTLSSADADLLDALNEASLLVRKQDVPPSGTVGLVSRARDDQANLLAQLYERARYGATVSISIAGRPLETINATDTLPRVGGRVHVTVNVSEGPEFSFGQISVTGRQPALGREAAAGAGLVQGDSASSRTILAGEQAIVAAWREAGYPFAEIADRQVVADHATRRLDVALTVKPGPRATLGNVEIRGADRLDEAFLIRQAEVPYGAPYHPATVERARRNLTKLDALASVSARVARRPGPDGHHPVIIKVSERKRRTIGIGADYSSTEGAGGQVFWQHRNLFGHAETLRLEARVGRLFEADTLDEYDALFSALLSIPGVWGPRTRLDLKALAVQEDPDPYNRRGVVGEATLVHELNEQTELRAGIVFDWARIDDAFGRNYYTLVGLPLSVIYDSRDNALDASEGIYARLLAEPQIELSSNALFFKTDAELRSYYAFDDDKRFILAGRALAGVIAGADIEDIPAHRRFYAGGGGSVRGYDYLNIGPRVDGFGATGGLARVEGSLEARIKVTDTIGIVPFIDAGLVTETTTFGGTDDFQIGVGFGLRYYTSVGPIRLDVAIPLDPRTGDPDFAVLAGIGQAF